jgi:hypothetical protein
MIDAPRPGKSVERIQLAGNAYYERMAWSIRQYAGVGFTEVGTFLAGVALFGAGAAAGPRQGRQKPTAPDHPNCCC